MVFTLKIDQLIDAILGLRSGHVRRKLSPVQRGPSLLLTGVVLNPPWTGDNFLLTCPLPHPRALGPSAEARCLGERARHDYAVLRVSVQQWKCRGKGRARKGWAGAGE